MSPVVVVVDDHPVLATAIADALSYRKIAVAIAVHPEADDAAEQMINAKPDLCLLDLDLGMHQAAGMRFVRAARAAGLRVAMLTGSTDEVALGRCIEAGAVGVVQKTLSFSEVIERIDTLLAGGQCNTDTDLLRWVLAAQRHDSEQARLLKPFAELSDRESVVLQHLIDGERVDEIAEADFVSIATIRSQVRSILLKVGVTSQLAAVAEARRAGWSTDRATESSSCR